MDTGKESQAQFVAEEFALVYPPGIEKHYWTVARNRVIAHQLRKVALGDSRVLEVGCGKGIVVDYLRGRGYDCRGVDLAAVDPLEPVREFVDTGVDAIDLPLHVRRSANVLLLLDVIEHLKDPVPFLERLLQHFPAVTDLIITVPARRELWSNYDEFYRHERRYDRRTLRETVEGLGAKVEDLRYFFHLLYPPARLLLAAGRERSVELTAPGRRGSLLHTLLACAFFLDYIALPAALPGTSLICRARVHTRRSQRCEEGGQAAAVPESPG